MTALRYVEERFRDLAQIVKEGHEAGLVGAVKLRSATGRDTGVEVAAAGKLSGGGAAAKPPAGSSSKNSSSFVGSGSASKTQPALQ